MLQHVLLVEDDDDLRIATAQTLELAGHEVQAFADARTALSAIDANFCGVVVSDIRMPRMDGLELLAEIIKLDPEIPVILVTGHGDVPMAVRALHDGAADFLTKPFAAEHLKATVRRSLEHRAMVVEIRRLRELAALADQDHPLLGASPAMKTLRSDIDILAAADLDVLIEGETGTGKELVAVALHRRGPRMRGPLVAFNCAGMSEDAAAGELFGHAADSVAHDRRARDGQIVISSGGTLLLDNVDALTMTLQARLLRVLEEREVHPIGQERPTAVNLHVVTTSSVDLATAVAEGRFREDLLYRLRASLLRVPPLRHRGDDVLALFGTFTEEAKEQHGVDHWAPDAFLVDYLRSHDWPGNVRELRSFAFAAVLGTAATPERVRDVQPDLPTRVANFEAKVIEDVLRTHRGNVVAALDVLGIPRKTLYDKMARHGIAPSRYRLAETGQV